MLDRQQLVDLRLLLGDVLEAVEDDVDRVDLAGGVRAAMTWRAIERASANVGLSEMSRYDGDRLDAAIAEVADRLLADRDDVDVDAGGALARG